jgi:hypothetical protein
VVGDEELELQEEAQQQERHVARVEDETGHRG